MRAGTTATDQPVWRIRLTPSCDGGDVVLSERGLTELMALLDRAATSDTCRLLTLEGAGGTFCRGMDLEALVRDPSAHARGGVAQYVACLRALRGFPKPLLALVDGEVLAGGVGLAAAADLILATERSSFGLPEVVVGLVPAMVMPLLLERMPAQKVRRLALTGLTATAREALAMGLVDAVVDDAEQLERALRRLARQLLRTKPEVSGQIKSLVAQMANEPWSDGVERGGRCTSRLLSEPETVAAIRAFGDGEPLPWFTRYRPPKTEA